MGLNKEFCHKTIIKHTQIAKYSKKICLKFEFGLQLSFRLTDDLGLDEFSNHPIKFHVPQPFGPLQFKGIILISSNSLASFNLHIHIFVRVLESNVHVQERSNVIRNTIITTIGALIIVGDETSSNKCSKKKTNNYIRVAFLYEQPFLSLHALKIRKV